IPPYCPHLNPIERLRRGMDKEVAPSKCYATCKDFADATLSFLHEKVPKSLTAFRDSATANFRVISPKGFRAMTRTGYS
ncbi:MAG: hypothetical protein ACREC0_13765, partial [Methylocella sp.]